MRYRTTVRSGSAPKPRDFFRDCENSANRIRKLLRSARTRRRASGTSGAMDDAVALTMLIENIARYGQTLPAAEAMDFAERLERLFDLLQAEVDTLLAS